MARHVSVSGRKNAAPGPDRQGLFVWLAHETARQAGKPAAFLLAAGIVVTWAALGPLFDYSDTWQLVINTFTTVVTFLMVFLIQSTQNRDTLALQLKLSELILFTKGASNRLAAIEDYSDEDLEKLHDQFRRQTAAVATTLRSRKGRSKKREGAAKPARG